MKRAARTAIALGCRATGILGAAERRNLDQLTILLYHRILPKERKSDYFLPDLVVTPEHFRSHCRTLRRHYDVLPLSRAMKQWAKPGKRLRPLVAITFDDGYGDNFEYAAPILDEFSIKATFFVVTGLIGRNQRPWYDAVGQAAERLQRRRCLQDVLQGKVIPLTGDAKPTDALTTPIGVVSWAKQLPPDLRKRVVETMLNAAPQDVAFSPLDGIMNWTQLGTLVEHGHEIGAHSCSHEILPMLNDDRLQIEIAGARNALQERLGIAVDAFCYPNGDFDERTLRAVRASGHTCATTVAPGNNRPGCDALTLNRWFIHQDRLAGFRGGASSTLLRMEICGLGARAFLRNGRKKILHENMAGVPAEIRSAASREDCR